MSEQRDTLRLIHASFSIALAAVVVIATFPSRPAHADWLGGALVGGGAGAIVGGIVGGRGGVAAGALIGGTVGAIEGDRREQERRRRAYRQRVYSQPVRTTQSSPLVVEVQVSLQRLGYDPGFPDGVAGARTSAAVRSYQHNYGLLVDGRISPQLLDHMRQRGG